jgi:sugar/nucleoside kinase (ribokinase family)
VVCFGEVLWDSLPEGLFLGGASLNAGDAFLAGLLAAVLRHGKSPPEALAHACRLGEFVAARSGATPSYLCDARGLPKVQSS